MKVCAPFNASVRWRSAAACSSWVFRDMVFQDVGFENNCCINPSPISVLGMKSPHLQLLRVDKLALFKPHILKHHIPELSTEGLGGGAALHSSHGLLADKRPDDALDLLSAPAKMGT